MLIPFRIIFQGKEVVIDLHNKKGGICISRLRRIDAPLGEYHVILKGNHGQIIFEDDDDRIAFFKGLIHYRKKYEFRLHAYALMDNHVHMLIHTDGKTMADFMHALQLKYIKHYREKYELDGHLFRGRYYSVAVHDTRSKIAELRYIHNNPVKAGLGTIDHYKWSSYNEYIKGKGICDTEDLMPLFDGVSGYQAIMALPDNSMCFEGSSYTRMSDQKAREMIASLTEECDIAGIANLPVDKRNKLLKKIHEKTKISCTQLCRLIGINRPLMKKILDA